MDRTNADDFRSNLKEWMEAARSEPVKITRKSGEAFVLVNADRFEKMQMELERLKGLTAGLMDVAQGKFKQTSPESTKDVLAKAKVRALARTKPRKAALG